jgi:hypothetical protein
MDYCSTLDVRGVVMIIDAYTGSVTINVQIVFIIFTQ